MKPLRNIENLYATISVDEVLKPINNIKTLLTALLSAIGVIFLVLEVFKAFEAFNSRDLTELKHHILGIAASLLITAIGLVTTFVMG